MIYLSAKQITVAGLPAAMTEYEFEHTGKVDGKPINGKKTYGVQFIFIYQGLAVDIQGMLSWNLNNQISESNMLIQKSAHKQICLKIAKSITIQIP
jgi:hypothetical protein